MTMVKDKNGYYVISKGEPYQLVNNDLEQIEGEYELTALDASLSLDLDNPGGKKLVERRDQERFHLRKDAFALIRSISAGPLNIQGNSMGGIASEVFNAKPARLGRIENISMGGLMFQHVACRTRLNSRSVVDILLADCRFYLANIQFEIKADIQLPADISDNSFQIRQVRLQFLNLSASQQAKLNELLLDHGTDIGEFGVKD